MSNEEPPRWWHKPFQIAIWGLLIVGVVGGAVDGCTGNVDICPAGRYDTC